jgi:putative nucleotidyltransferase with HDIG domain
MIESVNTALMEIQSALLARALYPNGHPRIGQSEKRAHELLQELLQERGEVTVFALDGRVIFDNEILPGCNSLADTLFRMLRLQGVDQLTFRRGLEQTEIVRFLDGLDHGGGDRAELRSSNHLGLGCLQLEQKGPSGPVKSSGIAYAQEAADVLPGIWQGLSDSQTIDLDVLGDIISCISRVVSETSSAMLPLAPLKQHDEYTFVHTINVAILSTALAEAIGFDSRAAHEISIAAMLHDVGKQVIPAELLNKDGLFNPEERRIMEQHPVGGARILINTPNIPDLATIVAYEHHVRADGSGYPKMPRGWKLNLASRVVQLTDVFDALRTDRPYRQGMPVPKIVELMKSDVGTFFDADLLQVFLARVVSRGIPDPAGAIPSPV